MYSSVWFSVLAWIFISKPVCMIYTGQQTPRPYTSGLKIKSSSYLPVSEPYYHTNYSKVFVHNKNYTSVFLDEPKTNSFVQPRPVYTPEGRKEKIETVLEEHNTNIVDKDTLNSRVVYKRKIEKQNTPQILSRCPKGVTGQFVYEGACNQFVDCWEGRGGPRNCAPGTLFNPKTLECDYPEKVECLTGYTANQIQRSAKIRTNQQAQCPPSFTGLIPNYTDCSRFIQCNDGMATSRFCPPGTLFDTNLNVCNHAKETACFSQKVRQTVNEEQHGNSADFTKASYTSNQVNQQIPKQGTVYIQYVMCDPSREDCATFHQGTFLLGPGGALCDPTNPECGRNVRQTIGTYFIKYVMCNTKYQDCAPFQNRVVEASYGNPPAQNGCNPQVQPCPTPNQQPNYKRGCAGGNCNQGQQRKEPKCPEGYQGLTKHPNDCKKFLNCANGITYIQDCGAGTLFNPNLKVCDFPYNVDCKSEDEEETTTINYYGAAGTSYDNVYTYQNPRPVGQPNNNCQGRQCYQPNSQNPSEATSFNNNKCPGGQCPFQPFPPTQPNQTNKRCQGVNCLFNQGQTKCQDGRCSGVQPPCQGYNCNFNTENHQVTNKGQFEDITDEFHAASTIRTFRQDGGQPITPATNIMRITPKPGRGHQQYHVTNQEDDVDIFNPNQFNDYTTTIRSQKKTWPPPFPDEATTDPDADYVFEYENGEPVTLAPENVKVEEKKKKTRCGEDDFVCDKRSCVAKSFVCDDVRDCSDGKDEKYCQTYMDEFKVLKNYRLDVLEKQRWDNVTYTTCALLCLDSRKFECKSFNYRKVDRACFLTSENVGTSGTLKSYYPCDYYERKSLSVDCSDMHQCPNGKCLKSQQVCDGYDDCGDRADEKGCRASDFGYNVKLAGRAQPHEGRVEVTVFGKTGYICDDQFDLADANILCKELGFTLGALEVKGNSHFAKNLRENHTLYMMDDIECLGNETSLMQCNFAGWGIHNCADGEIAGVVCRTSETSCKPDYWQCQSGNECVRIPFVCDGLNDCSDDSDEASHHCDSPTALRLINGTNPHEGRLEIRYHGIWGSICDDDFNEDAAKIVCNSLGYYGAVEVKKEAFFGKSNGPIWLDQVSCKGNESNLVQCSHWEWGENNCDHSEDVGIVCEASPLSVDPKRNMGNRGKQMSGKVQDLDSSDSSPPPVSCGFRKDNIFLQSDDVHFRVVQGSIAKPGDYPWQAALRINGQGKKTAHWCGAVVIAANWVLTAAHCLEGYPKGAYIVVAGEYNVNEDEGTEQQAFIEEYYLHENFKQGHKMGNDIAMVLLKGQGFRLNQDIQPICLPSEDADYERDLNCTISGFGTIETGKSAYSNQLRAAWIPIQKMDVCKMAHIYGDHINEGMICAGDLSGGADACDGDSGGPLACLEDGVFTLYGITSWGQRCGYANKPGVYVKVAHYRKWIEKIMKLHGST